MSIKWDELRTRYDELSQFLVNASLDPKKRQGYQKEHSRLSGLLEKRKDIEQLEKAIAQTQEQATAESDEEMAQLFADELEELKGRLAQEQAALDDLMFPPSEHDNRSVYLEIRAGTGGQEAALFAADLMKMYTNYALKRHWKATVDSSSTTDLGGFKEVVLHIKGKDAYGHLKHESGVHRVQRVPATETQGRVHTSTATVAVLPEAKEVDVQINPSDLRIDVYRASGAGGQHINTTDSAVRITHVPTGVVATCQEERSQHKNKAKAMKRLQAQILAAQVAKHEAEQSQKRKEQVGTGQRAEKVRTYNYPQGRVTDHQVNLTLKRLEYIMLGDLDEIIEALRDKERRERKESFAVSMSS